MKLRFITALAIGAASVLAATSQYRVVQRYPVNNSVEGWDYATIDSAARRLYLSHSSQVEVMDADSGKLIGSIPDTPGVHGIALAPGHRGFTSNGRENKVSLFDTESLKLIEKIDVGKGPDGIYYDAGSGRVFTNNHGSSDITAIDAPSGKVVGTVPIEGAGEQAVSAANGLIFVNLEDKNEVASFDPKTLAVRNHFPLGDAKTPTGLAYDAKNNRLFVMCRSKSLLVMDAADGKIIATFPIGAGVDFAGFDQDARMIFASNGDGTLSMIHQKSADEYEDVGPVITQPSAKTMAFDPKTKKVFLPAAEVTTIPNSDPNVRPTRKIKEGSFTVLVVSR